MTAPTAMPVCGLTLETFTAAVHTILSLIGIAEGFGVMTILLAGRERASALSASPCCASRSTRAHADKGGHFAM